MTAKDFNLIAEILRDLVADYRKDSRATEVVEDVVYEFAHRLSETNEKFQEELFLQKAGIK